MTDYRQRIVDSLLDRKLRSKGAVLIEGPKWCGKTTTAKQLSNSVIRLDEPEIKKDYLLMAELEPKRILDGKTPRLIDEWQVAPTLWDAIRHRVDDVKGYGQFILTGSSVPADMSKVIHSGTGRFAWIRMRPMTLFESGDSTGEVSLKDLFESNSISGASEMDVEKLSFLTCRGGWPETVDMDKDVALEPATDYVEGVMRRDINLVDGIPKDYQRVKALMRSYARNQGEQISFSKISADISINETSNVSDDTISTYVSALKKLFVVEDLPAWNPNLRSKAAIRTSDTRYFVDPSIAVASLGIGPGDLIRDTDTFGFFFETLVIRDLRVYAQSIDGEVYRYHDNRDNECDAVIHLRNGRYALIEIKLGGEKLISEGVTSLNSVLRNIDVEKMGEPSFMAIIVGIGRYAYRREDGIYIVPIGCLRD